MTQPGPPKIEITLGDIAVQHVDAIVNAANPTLLGGGGVDGAIHRAAGPQLLDECRGLRETILPRGLPVGEAVATGAGRLPARWVIHTVGPNRHLGQTDPALLEASFTNCLRTAREIGARSIAFPAISAGAYGWRVDEVARIAARVLGSPEAIGLDLIRVVVYSGRSERAFLHAFAHLLARDSTPDDAGV